MQRRTSGPPPGPRRAPAAVGRLRRCRITGGASAIGIAPSRGGSSTRGTRERCQSGSLGLLHSYSLPDGFRTKSRAYGARDLLSQRDVEYFIIHTAVKIYQRDVARGW